MSRTQEENNQNKRNKSSRANGIVITILFAALDLILLGVFGKAGKVLMDFFVGTFGYAVYGYSFALTLLGIFMCMNVKHKQSFKIILLYVVIAALVIMFAHILVSHNYALDGWGNYIKQSYQSANTAGGAIASIFLYPFATKKIYILSLVAGGILTVGFIVIAILLQVNINIHLERFSFGKKGKVTSGQNANVGMFDVDYNADNGVYLRNQTVDGRDMGERLTAKGRRKGGLDNYVPIDRLNVSEEQNFEFYTDSVPEEYTDDSARLILDTEEVRSELDRSGLIYAKDDIVQDDSIDISQAQRDIFGIDGGQRFNVIDEGIQNNALESNDASQKIDASKYEGFSTNERLRIIAENERLSKMVKREESLPESIKREEKHTSFSDKLKSILNKGGEVKKEEDKTFDFDFGSLKDVKDKKVESDEIKNDILPENKISEPEKPARSVEDKSEKSQPESMDEFIAKMNKQKQQQDKPVINNYKVTENIQPKTETQPTDGYFKKTFDPKPITPITPTPRQPVNNAADKKTGAVEEIKKQAEEEKKVEEKPAEKVKRSPYVPPSIENLKDYIDVADFSEDYNEKAKIIENTYANFGIEVHVKNIVSGPAVTRFEFEIPATIPVDRIPQKSKNVLMALAVTSLRIEAPIPGKSLCGIEIPNAKRKTVGLKEFIVSDEFKNKKGGLCFALGKDIDNNCHYEDLTDFPHGLIAGGTGSGKSVCLNTMLCSLIYKYSPEQLRIILVDPKRVEFGKYKELPHLLTPKIYNTPKESLNILRWLVEEMTRRYTLFEQYFVNKISTYNSLDEVIADEKTIPYIVTIIDEVGDIMVSEFAKEFENLVLTLTQKARACGIHLILATQRPSVDVITGTIKVNLPTRIAFAVTSGVDSKTILDSIGAEDLLGKGDMLFKTTKSRYLERLQNPFIDDIEIKNIMVDITQHNKAYYDENVIKQITAIEEPPKKEDPLAVKNIKEFDFPDDLCPDVLRRIAGSDKVSISSLQRMFSIGFSRGGKIYDWLMANNYIEKLAENKCVCRLSPDQVEEIIENARNAQDGEDE